VSDPVSRCGLWVHHEVVAPTEGAPYLGGWVAAFEGTGGPLLERFGPLPLSTGRLREIPSLPETTIQPAPPASLSGKLGRVEWDLVSTTSSEQRPLFTFPKWAWEREVFPAAQVVPYPSIALGGTLALEGRELSLSPETRGNLAHIYGHGNAERWGWLHADLGGGDVLEIVTAVSRRKGLSHLKPLAFVQLRTAGADWPRDPLFAASLFHTDLSLPIWSVRGTIGRLRLDAEITIDPGRAVSLQYVDPDGTTATCTNSELADADISLERRRSRWEELGRWSLKGTAHSEVGTRP
jgi:hypothetical protein